MSDFQEGKVNIRRMMESDIQGIMTLDREVGPERSVLSYEDISVIEHGGPGLGFVAEINNKIVGFLISRLVYLMIPFTEVCVLQGIYVHPELQDRHIGSKLMQGLLKHCQAEGIKTVRALIPENDKHLQEFVNYHGFHPSTILNFDKSL